jgi:hypothetical protein
LVDNFINTTIEIDKKFEFSDIYWKIENNNKLDLDSDGRLITIPILEDIIGGKIKPRDNLSISQMVSGTLVIDTECIVDEYEIYVRYNAIFPNLKIQYSNRVTINNAITVYFMKTDLDDSEILLELKVDKNTTLLQGLKKGYGNNEYFGKYGTSKPMDNVFEYYWNTIDDDPEKYYEYSEYDWRIENTDEKFEHDSSKMQNYKFDWVDDTIETVKIIPLFSKKYRTYNV